MAYWTLNIGWRFNTTLTNLRVVQANKDGQRAIPRQNYLKVPRPFSCAIKGGKRPINAIQTVSNALVSYILSKWPSNSNVTAYWRWPLNSVQFYSNWGKWFPGYSQTSSDRHLYCLISYRAGACHYWIFPDFLKKSSFKMPDSRSKNSNESILFRRNIDQYSLGESV